MNRSLSTLLLLLAPLAGCGPTVCDYSQEWADRCDVTWTEADSNACRSTYRTCSAQEKQKLEAFWLCMDQRGFFECRTADTGAPGAASPVAEDLLACQPELRGVTTSCSRAIGIDGGEFAGLETTGTTTGTTSR